MNGPSTGAPVLIVLAHPPSPPRVLHRRLGLAPQRDAARAAGARVHLVRLNPMGSNPVEGARGHYRTPPAPFDPLKAHEARCRGAGTVPTDAQAEADKIAAADLIVFHFPIWWYRPARDPEGLARPLPDPWRPA